MSSKDAGFTVAELLVASGIMLATTATVFVLLEGALKRSHEWNDAADLHQRGRVAIEAMTRVVSAAGVSVPIASEIPAFPPIEPRRRSTFIHSPSAITVRHVPELGAWTTLASDVAPGATTANLDARAGCPTGRAACGFQVDMDAVVLDAVAGWHLLTVGAVFPDALEISDRVPGRTRTFPRGSPIAEIVETSLYFDRAGGTLRQEGPGAGDFAVVDNLEDLGFDYRGAGLTPISLRELSDGPLCGTGSLAYDCDLLRVRHVRATVTIAPSRPGSTRLTLNADLSPRSLRR